jgi:hypothetical protein
VREIFGTARRAMASAGRHRRPLIGDTGVSDAREAEHTTSPTAGLKAHSMQVRPALWKTLALTNIIPHPQTTDKTRPKTRRKELPLLKIVILSKLLGLLASHSDDCAPRLLSIQVFMPNYTDENCVQLHPFFNAGAGKDDSDLRQSEPRTVK